MSEFHKILSDWYKHNKRDLPWRSNRDPYYVWISEIILQQTRVDQGTEYFVRFIAQFPNIASLAGSSENELLKMWQGLGYYSRARNIYVAAGQIMNHFNGRFPDSHNDILKLKGVGDYTAAAIASIAFGLPHAAIDGNVYRVLSRIFGIHTPIDSTQGKREFLELSTFLIDRDSPGAYNEALMEFGALQCVPRNPDCTVCPFQNQCIAFSRSEIAALPVKSIKVKVRHRFFNYLYLKHDKSIILEKREGNDIWQNMYQLPLIESLKSLTVNELAGDEKFRLMFENESIVIETVGGEILHVLSHQKLHVRFFEISTLEAPKRSGWINIIPEALSEYPIPKLIDNFLMEKNRNKMD
ncbi:MAG: A/G-specific adenine glycosylase [Mariniphaga sp.]